LILLDVFTLRSITQGHLYGMTVATQELLPQSIWVLPEPDQKTAFGPRKINLVGAQELAERRIVVPTEPSSLNEECCKFYRRVYPGVCGARAPGDGGLDLAGQVIVTNHLRYRLASPRTKLPNSGQKRPSRRMTRVQNRFLTVAIFAHRGRRATFQRGDARSADFFGRNELDQMFATLASYDYALALDMLKEGPLLWPVDVPKAEIVLVCAHLKAPPQPTMV
jgi:hypothetical protein